MRLPVPSFFSQATIHVYKTARRRSELALLNTLFKALSQYVMVEDEGLAEQGVD
jgi:hypothetical protein